MKRQEWTALQLLVLGVLFGVLGTAVYDLFKIWLNVLWLEERHLTPLDVKMALIPVYAATLAVVFLFAVFYRLGLLKKGKK